MIGYKQLQRKLDPLVWFCLVFMLTHNYYDEVHFLNTHHEHSIDLAREARNHRDQESTEPPLELMSEYVPEGNPNDDQ